MSDEGRLKKLLDEVRLIVERDRAIQKGRFARGEKFNVFNVLNLRTQEVCLHSAFLAELLAPDGSHGLGDAFLKLFFKENHIDCDTRECRVSVEKYIGTKTETEGGRLDIYIRASNFIVLIENKIYAGDQENQLLRYREFAKKHSEGGDKFRIFYLTLDGHEASSWSTAGEKIEYSCISYSNTIANWLEGCLQIAYSHPLVRETIKQYQTLIKQLTGGDMESSNIDKIIELVSQKEYLSLAHTISDQMGRIKTSAFKNYFIPNLESRLEKEGGGHVELETDDITVSHASFSVYLHGRSNFQVTFEFESRGCRNLFSGIPVKLKKIPSEEVKSSLENLKETNLDFVKLRGIDIDLVKWPSWYCSRYFDDFRAWDAEAFEMIYDKDSALYETVLKEIEMWMELTKDINFGDEEQSNSKNNLLPLT